MYQEYYCKRRITIIILLIKHPVENNNHFVVETEIIDYYFLIDEVAYKTYQEYYYGRKYNNCYPTRQVDENKYYLLFRRRN